MELDPLIEKIVETIRRDVNNIYTKAAGSTMLPMEAQEALIKYYKVLTDARLAEKERRAEQLIKDAEEILARGSAKEA